MRSLTDSINKKLLWNLQESMLKNLESKVREQDAYWTKVVLMKDNEIENLKTVTEASWAGK